MSERITVVTSCSAVGFEQYGRRFVETFRQFWPAGVALHVVSEDEIEGALRLHDISPSAAAFEARHRDNLAAHGREPEQLARQKSTKTKDYNFRFDAYRFCKKVFAIEAVAKSLDGGGRLFWVDADCETFASVSVELLERLLPRDAALSCLDRGESYHSECGFVGYNLDHPQTRPFITAFADLYASDAVFELQEWHDSWVFDWLRRFMKVPAFAIPHNSRSHPFVNSELGFCLDHKKGRRKDRGGTPSREVLSSKKRALPYWRAAMVRT